METLVKLKLGSDLHDIVRRSDKTFDVDGVSVEASVVAAGASRFEGRTPSGSKRLFVTRDGDRVFAQVGSRAYGLTVVKRAAITSSADSAAQGGLEAPMPGRVTRVAVAVGDDVKRGQELIVVEAMKMENALVAPIDGVVRSLAVKVGDMVAPGPALIVIDVIEDAIEDAP
jgi:biotin carboxyl carrier protein